MSQNENGPGAAATAHRAESVALAKSTGSNNPNPEDRQLRKGPVATVPSDKTGGKQALRLSLRAAVDAKCRSCIYDPEEGNGTWREQVQACSSVNCPLHAVRPITVKAQKAGAEARGAAARVFRPSPVESPFRVEQLDLNGLNADERRAA